MCVQCISICVYIYITKSAWIHTAISKCHSFNVPAKNNYNVTTYLADHLVVPHDVHHALSPGARKTMEKPRKSVILPVNSKPWVF